MLDDKSCQWVEMSDELRRLYLFLQQRASRVLDEKMAALYGEVSVPVK